MSRISECACLLLCLCAGVTAGHASSTTVDGNQIMATLRGIEGMLKRRQCPNTELAELKKELSSLKGKLEATETKLEATETKLEAKLEATEKKLQEHSKAIMSGLQGSTFVRWGRKTCTKHSRLVYSGVAGGGHYNHPGAAVNSLCLTMKPQTKSIPAAQRYTLLYGTEYENIPNHHNHDVPCSVCRAPQPTTIMIPATWSCPTGWTTQYTGTLVAGHYTFKAANEYVCLDGNPEDMASGHKNLDGNLFYYTHTVCGSLPCPPYTDNALVLCVVCSK